MLNLANNQQILNKYLGQELIFPLEIKIYFFLAMEYEHGCAYPTFSHLFLSLFLSIFNSLPCTDIRTSMCCGWWLIYVVDSWSLWLSGVLMASILVAQVTTVLSLERLVVKQWRLIVALSS